MLLTNDNYEKIDAKMSDSNCGARKNRNVRDHLFVVHGVINDVINGKAEPTALQIYDVKQCFDAMWFKKAMNNLYDVDMNDDHFSLLSETNLKSNIKVKTPVGPSETFEINSVIMQGGKLTKMFGTNGLHALLAK